MERLATRARLAYLIADSLASTGNTGPMSDLATRAQRLFRPGWNRSGSSEWVLSVRKGVTEDSKPKTARDKQPETATGDSGETAARAAFKHSIQDGRNLATAQHSPRPPSCWYSNNLI